MSFVEKHSIESESDAIQFLQSNVRIKTAMESVVDYSSDGKTQISTIRDTLSAIKEIQEHFRGTQSWELNYWLGKGFSWCGERYSSIEHLETAYELSNGNLENHVSIGQKQNTNTIDRNDIAFEISESCLKIGHPSFVEQAIVYLQKIMDNTSGYHPGLALLAESYFEKGMYTETAKIASEAHTRLQNDSYWLNLTENPKFLLNLMSKCYSRQALQLRDKGEIAKVVETLETAKENGVIKSIDRDLLKKMKQQQKILIDEKKHLEEIITSKSILWAIRRDLKKKFPDVTIDYEALKQEITRRIQSV